MKASPQPLAVPGRLLWMDFRLRTQLSDWAWMAFSGIALLITAGLALAAALWMRSGAPAEAQVLMRLPASGWAYCVTDIVPGELTCTAGIRRRSGYETGASYSQVDGWYRDRFLNWGSLQFGKSGLALRLGPEPSPWTDNHSANGPITGLPRPPSAPGKTLFYVTEEYGLYLRIAPWEISFLR